MGVAYAEPRPTVQSSAITSDPRTVVTPLDADRIEQLLGNVGLLAQWQHIVHNIRHGFDVGINKPVTQTLIFPNHASSQLDESFIDSYIAEEHAAGRYSIPFTPSELESVIGCFRTAPLGLVPKPHSDKFRLIQDLSYPRNDVRTPICTVR